jgi:hypothetical protein
MGHYRWLNWSYASAVPVSFETFLDDLAYLLRQSNFFLPTHDDVRHSPLAGLSFWISGEESSSAG